MRVWVAESGPKCFDHAPAPFVTEFYSDECSIKPDLERIWNYIWDGAFLDIEGVRASQNPFLKQWHRCNQKS